VQGVLLAIDLDHIAKKDIADVWLDTRKTFNDNLAPIDYRPFVPSNGNCMFVYRRTDLTDDEFSPTCMAKNMDRVADVLMKFPVNELGLLDSPFYYQSSVTDITNSKTGKQERYNTGVSATQLHPQRTQQQFAESLENMQWEQTRLAGSLESM
jgi:hypothetical protein